MSQTASSPVLFKTFRNRLFRSSRGLFGGLRISSLLFGDDGSVGFICPQLALECCAAEYEASVKRISTSQFEPVVQDRESTKMHEFKDVRE